MQEMLNVWRQRSLDSGLAGLARTLAPEPAGLRPPLAKDPARGNMPLPPRTSTYYFLWSFGQTAQAMGLEKLGGQDWHAWGSSTLLASQKADGSWQGAFGPMADTCFALLFLKKANLTPATLKGQITDPGEQKPLAAADKEVPGEKEAAQLKKLLAQATTGAQQERILAKVRDAGAEINGLALARLLPQVKDSMQTKVRAVLAQRLGRLKTQDLRRALEETDIEMCRAAITACAERKSKLFVPDLIRLLDDPEAQIVQSAAAALTKLTGANHGPADAADLEQRVTAVAAWQEWWEKQQDKKKK